MAVTTSEPFRLSSALRDTRVLQIVGQIIFAVLLIAALYGLITSILAALAAQNLTPNLNFLQNRAGFPIGEAPPWYSANESYWTAYTIGLTNTLRIVLLGLLLSTVVGILVGIFLLSNNWLVRTISKVYVELLRNTPLLVQLFIWYFVVMLSLPAFQQSIALPQEGYTFIPIRVGLYLLAGLYLYSMLGRIPPQQHERRAMIVPAFFAAVAVIELGFWVLSRTTPDDPRLPLFVLVSGVVLLVLAVVAKNIRPAALGALIGLIIGAALFFTRIIPDNTLRLELQPWIMLNIRGFAFPELLPTSRMVEWLAFVAVGVALAFILWIYLGRVTETSGQRFPRFIYAILSIAVFAVVGWLLVSAEPAPTAIPVKNADGQTVLMTRDEAREAGLLTLEAEQVYAQAPLLFRLPTRNNFRFTSGSTITPEYLALLLGLTIYTSAFIAEIVRAGILAVPRGQVEAARALGLNYSDLLRLVILPQALRVIIPPLGNQYLNLTKNSSLAIAIAYSDLFQITTIIMNQSGQSVTGMMMVMLTYLILSLIIAAVMSRANRRFQLVTR